MSESRAEVLVVGAGIAGLIAARELVLRGHPVRVLEASDRAGGQIAAADLDGLKVDVGADRFTPTPELLAQFDRLGLGDRLVPADPARTWLRSADGRTLPVLDPNWLGIPMSPLAADTIAIVGRRGAWRALRDSLLPGPVGASAPSLGALVRRRYGDEFVQRLVAPIVLAERGVHPDAVPVEAVEGLAHHLLRENSLARAVARVRLEGATAGQVDRPVASLDGGVIALVDLLLADLERFGVAIEFGARVERVAQDHLVLAADPLAVELSADPVPDHDPDAGRVRHGRVLLAAPGLTPGASEPGEPGPSHTGAVVTLVVDGALGIEAALGGSLAGSTLVVDPATGSSVRSLDLPTVRWAPLRAASAGRSVMRVRYRDAPAENTPDVEQARRDAAELLGVGIPPAAVMAADVRSWSTAARVRPEAEVPMVGEQVVGADLARIIPHARAAARALAEPDN